MCYVMAYFVDLLLETTGGNSARGAVYLRSPGLGGIRICFTRFLGLQNREYREAL